MWHYSLNNLFPACLFFFSLTHSHKKNSYSSFKCHCAFWIVKAAPDETVRSYSNLFIFYSNICKPGACAWPIIPVTPEILKLCFQTSNTNIILVNEDRKEVHDHCLEEVPSCNKHCLTAWAWVQTACFYVWQSGKCPLTAKDAKEKG